MQEKPLFTTAPHAVVCSSKNPMHPMFGKMIELDYMYAYVHIQSAFCEVIAIIGEESIHTLHVGSGHGIFLSITEQRADSDSKEVLRIPFKSSLNRNEQFLADVTTQIALILVHKDVYEVNKELIDTAIRKILPY